MGKQKKENAIFNDASSQSDRAINQTIDGRTKPWLALRNKGRFLTDHRVHLSFVDRRKSTGFPGFVREADRCDAADRGDHHPRDGKRDEACLIFHPWRMDPLSHARGAHSRHLLYLREAYFPRWERSGLYINRFWRYDLQRGVKHLD